MKRGTVYWITGLSGAGKTTIGTMLYKFLKQKKNNVIRLDGDVLRNVFQSFDYTYEGRKKLGFQYSKLCQLISSQGIDVIISVIAMYDEVRFWNRKNIPLYKEIYLEVEIEELIKRDQKGIYSRALRDKEENVYGINLKAELPQHSDIVIQNYGNVTPELAFNMIINNMKI